MTRDGLVQALAGAVIALMLASLVVASFVVVPRPAPAAVRASVATGTRAAPVARGLARGASIVSIESETAPPTPDPTPVPTPVPTPLPTPVPTPPPTPSPSPTPAPTAPPTPVRTPPPLRSVPVVVTAATVAAEQRMLVLMNASRTAGGLVALVMDAVVVDTARAHSAAEATVRYVYHDGPDGTARSRDGTACGSGWYGENTGKIWNDNVAALHIEFMNEPWPTDGEINHRTNIMDPNFRRVGVGAVQGPDALYMTMVFCR